MTAIQGQSRPTGRTAEKAQSRSSSAADWTPTSWRGRPALQMPVYPDAAILEGVEERLLAGSMRGGAGLVVAGGEAGRGIDEDVGSGWLCNSWLKKHRS